MSLEVVGALCVAAALVGPRLKIGDVHIPHLSKAKMIALAVVGALFIALGLAQQFLAAPHNSAIEHIHDRGGNRI
jgi:type VI protein secretion system component VasK